MYWEGKEREKHRQLEFLAQELITVGNVSKVNNEQVSILLLLFYMNAVACGLLIQSGFHLSVYTYLFIVAVIVVRGRRR